MFNSIFRINGKSFYWWNNAKIIISWSNKEGNLNSFWNGGKCWKRDWNNMFTLKARYQIIVKVDQLSGFQFHWKHFWFYKVHTSFSTFWAQFSGDYSFENVSLGTTNNRTNSVKKTKEFVQELALNWWNIVRKKWTT